MHDPMVRTGELMLSNLAGILDLDVDEASTLVLLLY